MAGSSARESRPMSSSSSARCASSAVRRRDCQYALTASPTAITTMPASAHRIAGGTARMISPTSPVTRDGERRRTGRRGAARPPATPRRAPRARARRPARADGRGGAAIARARRARRGRRRGAAGGGGRRPPRPRRARPESSPVPAVAAAAAGARVGAGVGHRDGGRRRRRHGRRERQVGGAGAPAAAAARTGQRRQLLDHLAHRVAARRRKLRDARRRTGSQDRHDQQRCPEHAHPPKPHFLLGALTPSLDRMAPRGHISADQPTRPAAIASTTAAVDGRARSAARVATNSARVNGPSTSGTHHHARVLGRTARATAAAPPRR